MKSISKKHWFLIRENGGDYARVTAYDVEHALEKTYNDGGPGSLVEIEVLRWEKVKMGSFRFDKWVSKWSGGWANI